MQTPNDNESEEELFKNIDVKKIGEIGLVVAVSVIVYYGFSAYKVYLETTKLSLEIQDLKKGKK